MLVRPSDLIDKFVALKKIEVKKKTQSTGFKDLDEFMRLAKRYLFIVTGYPSSGKSEFVDAILVNMAIMHCWRTLFFSPENEPIEEHMAKLAEKYIGKPIQQFTSDDIDKSLAFLEKYFTWVNPEEPELPTLLKLADEEKKERGLDCFVIDPWNSVTHNRGKELVHEYLQVALTKLIKFGRKNEVLMTVVAHPKTPIKDRDGNIPPLTLYDISDGAMWRNKADYGAVCERLDSRKHQLLVKIQKIKFKWMGQVGEALFDYQVATGRFKGTADTDFYLPHEIESPF